MARSPGIGRGNCHFDSVAAGARAIPSRPIFGAAVETVACARGQEGLQQPANPEKETTMKKFMVLYRAPLTSFDQAMKAPPEQQKGIMDAWMAWAEKAKGAIVDLGAPLGKTLKVTPAGTSPSRNDIGGYSILQGESKEAIAALMKGHPHFGMSDGFIEVVDMVDM
jgi:hypothetical protein